MNKIDFSHAKFSIVLVRDVAPTSIFFGKLYLCTIAFKFRAQAIFYVFQNTHTPKFKTLELQNIYRMGGLLFTRWEVRTRPQAIFETEAKYFSVRTDLNGK